MQMHDIFPTSPYAKNTHELMECGENKSTYGDVASHYNNIFDTSDHADWYRNQVNKEFLHIMYR